MFKRTSRSIAVVSILTFCVPCAAFAVDQGAAASEMAPQAVVTAAPVSAVQADERGEAPSLVDMLFGFFYAVVQVGGPGPGQSSAGPGAQPTSRGPLIDPVGHQAE